MQRGRSSLSLTNPNPLSGASSPSSPAPAVKHLPGTSTPWLQPNFKSAFTGNRGQKRERLLRATNPWKGNYFENILLWNLESARLEGGFLVSMLIVTLFTIGESSSHLVVIASFSNESCLKYKKVN